MNPIPIRTRTRLDVTYSLHPADEPVSQFWVVLHHGICHTREQFRKLIAALNALGLNVVMIDQQSETAADRNWITIQQYRDGMAEALQQLQEKHRDISIGCYALHSMGALIGELLQSTYPQYRRPTVLMTPLPPWLGAFPITVRLLLGRFKDYVSAVRTFDIGSLARTSEQVNAIFFDRNATSESLAEVVGKLKHASFLSYVQLVLPWPARPWRWDNRLPKLLLTSPADRIFKPWEYWLVRLRSSQITRAMIGGGHDFFIPHAEWTAGQIFTFLKRHEELSLDIEAEAARLNYAGPHFAQQPDHAIENVGDDQQHGEH